MTVHAFDPLKDFRWSDFVEEHPGASVFHTPGWLQALQLTYGYQPIVFTTSPLGCKLTDGIVFCRVSSWLTGCRMVSLPFADHCEPLFESAGAGEELVGFLRGSCKTENWKYIELRPLTSSRLPEIDPQEKGSSFCYHRLDLRPAVNELFDKMQKSSIQRMIRRAERQGLSYEEGRSEALLAKFYCLMLQTRRRHQLPPQPLSWFRNLISCMGNRLSIRLASKDGKPLASILTLAHRNTLVYKYGCSDASYHHCGSVPFLIWESIRKAKKNGFQEFDLGRSDLDNPGLITFKNRLGATPSTLDYVRFSRACSNHATENRGMHVAKRLFACMPDGLLTAAGKLLYRHIG